MGFAHNVWLSYLENRLARVKNTITFPLHPKKCLPTLSIFSLPLLLLFFYLPTSFLNRECDLLVIRTLSTKETYLPNRLEFFHWYTAELVWLDKNVSLN